MKKAKQKRRREIKIRKKRGGEKVEVLIKEDEKAEKIREDEAGLVKRRRKS